MEDFEIELKQGFLEEAAQALTEVEQCFLALESSPKDEENLKKIFRLAHNLKGSSKAVGFDQMGAFTHEFESYILKIKNGELDPSPAVVGLLLKGNDFIGLMIEKLRGDLSATFDIEPLIEELRASAEGRGGYASPPPAEPEAEVTASEVSEVETNEVEAAPVEEWAPSASDSANPFAVQATVESPVETPVEAAPSVSLPPPAAASEKSPEAPKATNAPEESIRISVSKVEKLLNTIGEMVILQSVIAAQASQSGMLTLRKTLHQLGKVTKEIQEISMGLRMVPVKPTFQKMQRIVRDTTKALGKDVQLALIGEDTEIDKTVLEKINDPLVHLVRNACDHGIENAETRIANGKEARGHICLSAFHRSGKLVIEVRDDGGGLNAQKLTQKAIEKGLLKAGTTLSESDAFNLIFAPGFSTKEVVSDVSGRGVGMDVVRTNIQELSGEITIASQLGKGTTFQVILPLTLAIIDGMIMSYGEERFIIPFNHIAETLRPTEKDVQFNQGLGHTLMLRGENIPIFRVGDFLGIPSSRAHEQMIALVIRSGKTPFALFVDDVIGQSQVVVKQLGPELRNFTGASGCTILGDGRPAIILEPIDLIKRKFAPVKTSPTLGGKAA